MRLKNLLTLSGTSLFFLLIIGCAKTNVYETFSVANTGMPRPNSVLIYIFVKNVSVPVPSSENYRTTQSNDNQLLKDIQSQLDRREREVSDTMATELDKKISALGLNTIRADQNSRETPTSIMVTINFDIDDYLNVNESGTNRDGQSSLISSVSVLAPSASGNRELLSFNVNADNFYTERGGNVARAWTMGRMGPVGAGESAIIATNIATSTQQAKKMSEDIAAQLAKYFAQQGWINASSAK